MEKYSVEFKKSAVKDLREFPKKDVERILAVIRALADNPRPLGSKKLSAQERYRIRQGDYRIIYEILDNVLVVIVVKIGHRKDVYSK